MENSHFLLQLYRNLDRRVFYDNSIFIMFRVILIHTAIQFSELYIYIYIWEEQFHFHKSSNQVFSISEFQNWLHAVPIFSASFHERPFILADDLDTNHMYIRSSSMNIYWSIFSKGIQFFLKTLYMPEIS